MTEKLIKDADKTAVSRILRQYLFAGLVLISIAGLLISCPRKAYSAQVTLTWDAPTYQGVAGYKVYYGTASRTYSNTIDVGNVTTSVVSGLSAGTAYYFAVTAYDTSGNESYYSNEVSKTISASDQYSLSIAKSGTGAGTVTSSTGGISCGSTCSADYNTGSVVTLTASPSSSSSFAGWSGGTCSGIGTCSLTMDGNTTVAGQFSANPHITATAGSEGSISPSGTVTLNQGASQTFAITPASNYTIADVQVDGTSVGAVSSYAFNNVTSSHTISATFNSVPVSCSNPPVEEGSVSYSSIQSAYTAAQNGASVQVQVRSLNEDLDFSRNISLSLVGGYDCGFTTELSYSTITGSMVIGAGSVTIDNIAIQ